MPDFVGRCRSLRSLIEEHASKDADATRLAEPVAQAVLRDSEIMRMWLPRSLGGEESRPTELMEVVEELTYADGCVGWVAGTAIFATASASAYCGDAAAAELWSDQRLSIMEGAGMPGVAEVTDDGYVLSGKWSYGSGVKHASHVYSRATIHEDGRPRLRADGRPETIMTIVPREDVVLGDNWDVMGLRGTGSVDYSIDGVFVPEAYTHPTDAATSQRGGRLYWLGMMGLACPIHAAWAIGNARRALDELSAFAARRPDRAADQHLQLRSAQAFASLYAARDHLQCLWQEIEAALERSEPLSVRQHTLMRLAVNHATFAAADVCEHVYRASGGAGLRAGRIQRCFRDANAATQHAIVSDGLLEECGRQLLGRADGEVWVEFYELGATRPR